MSKQREFERIMGDLTMPDSNSSHYDLWIFDKTWQARQPEIDRLREQQLSDAAVYDRAFIEIQSQKGEIERLNGMLSDIRNVVTTADGWGDGETFYKSSIEEIRDILSNTQDIAAQCICGEINARHCPVHNEEPQ